MNFEYEKYNKAIKKVPASTSPDLLTYKAGATRDELDYYQKVRNKYEERSQRFAQRDLSISADLGLLVSGRDALLRSDIAHQILGYPNCKGLRDHE